MEPKFKSECHLMKIAFNGVLSSLFYDAKKKQTCTLVTIQKWLN